MNGIWLVLRNTESADIDEVFIGYGDSGWVKIGVTLSNVKYIKLVPNQPSLIYWGYDLITTNYSDAWGVAVLTGLGINSGWAGIPSTYSVQVFAAVI